MRISKETLKGYLLEEALAYLLKKTGYRLLVDPLQDPIELKRRGNGLVVTGRGGEHQADILGQLLWIPSFSYPIRLFVEAKFRSQKTGIDVVRNAVGIIDDLNENYSPMRERRILVKRYSYNYAIFSTSGFSKNAIDMAIAHRISLIDMSGPEFSALRVAIDQAAHGFILSYKIDDEIATTKDDQNEPISRGGIVQQLRYYLRKNLGTWPNEVEWLQIPEEISTNFSLILKNLIKEITQHGELFVGMANGPFLLVLKANSPEEFRNYARQNPTHKIHITWNNYNGRRWIISPLDGGYKLSFTLPEALEAFIFRSNNPIRKALVAKQQFLSSITIYSYSEFKDEIYRLEYEVNNDVQSD